VEEQIVAPVPQDGETAHEEPAFDEGAARPQPAEPLHRARAAQRGYYRWRRLSRFALTAFVIIGGVTLVWLVPWLRIGLNTTDYTPQLAFTVYLLGGGAILAFLVLGSRELAQRDRERLLAWATVFDEATGLHNRTYFHDRLDLECARGPITREPFSVVVLQFRGLGAGKRATLSSSTLQQIADQISGLIRRHDLVALLTANELVVLAMSVASPERLELEVRLRRTVSASLPERLSGPANMVLRIGGATYGSDGMLPGALIQTARTAAGFGTVPHIKTA